ncbi:SPP1 family prophage L54a [Staphylococcus schweitzeri]|uniref:SPP1 family prophage L54a n=1 Tax=Staphylococcus schweitzeri TaxID=1654388 RepID=A0A077V3W7_9STAP|nr:SPP1 family prophage L54a [Staphylococcus schweitzeri]CDR54786.1 SPP1 family prophage L54a [Staphylococcus schweitzeri]CDR62403.1 SPP1 family prophage L54a [Staphylococcus schweitzeri]VEE65330.1 holin, SPP1 family [Staphylococcus schweitzeri]
MDKRSKQIDTKVISRYFVLILALGNQFLANKGISPIPVDDETISSIRFIVVAFCTNYKNNSISQEGKWANQKLKKYKAENKYRKATGQVPIKEVMTPTNMNDTNDLG